ncbi:hypothetical protein DSLASN_22910 [Desulfoluna limicola]|uniref:Uncharacterized protein n=1 Tax=Desulfoluna limicola TaxID=2810562 RepID=A0ABM7PH97_9BACT|nr:hypothetical protein DSLASN_22910 [Desulfoluna limicola]
MRFRYRTPYFTNSGISGSKTFVLATYEVFKGRRYANRERVTKQVKGIDGTGDRQNTQRFTF